MKKSFFRLIMVVIPLFATNAYCQAYNELYRPQFHFTPPEFWMNDPNGMVYHDGFYHLFYQYYPKDVVWGPMHWGHARSTDLIHWEQLPIALYPDEKGNIFSGSAVVDTFNTAGFGKNAMVAIFTYHDDKIWERGQKNTESQAIAFSGDGTTWTKYKSNPVLNNSGQQDFRDPKVFWNQRTNRWTMVLAAHDVIKIFTSTDLKHWEFASDFKPIENNELGVWECPDLFPMEFANAETQGGPGETKWVMIVNHGTKAPNGGSGTRYFVGTFDGKKFTAESPARWMDYGTDFYAGVTFSNAPDGKRILLGWMSNWQYAAQTPTTAWRGAMTLPRELELGQDAKGFFLKQKMIQQFASITKPILASTFEKLPFEKKVLQLSQSEISFTIEKRTQSLIVQFSNSLGEVFRISLKPGELTTDRTKSGKTDFSDKFASEQTMPLNDEITNFQIIVDKSSVEILLNDGKYSMTNQVFPNEDYSTLIIKAEGISEIKNFRINSVGRIWN